MRTKTGFASKLDKDSRAVTGLVILETLDDQLARTFITKSALADDPLTP
jgi:hypothetical protein